MLAGMWPLVLALAVAEPEASEPAPEPGAKAGEPATGESEEDGESEEAEEAEESEAMARARVLYEDGAVAYSAADYALAIEKFTESLRIITIEPGEFPSQSRGLLLFNLATAHERAFVVDDDLEHLRKARDLYGRIVQEALAFAYGDELVEQAGAAETRVDERVKELEAQARAQERAREEREQAVLARAASQQDKPAPRGRKLMIAGAVLTGAGVAISGVWIAGLLVGRRAEDDVNGLTRPSDDAMRRDAIDEGRLGNGLAIGGAVAAGILIPTGVALLAVGAARHRRDKRSACAPALSPRLAGLSCRVRF